MKPTLQAWTIHDSGIQSAYTHKGKLIGSVWQGRTGWWASSGTMGGPVTVHPTLAQARAAVLGGAA